MFILRPVEDEDFNEQPRTWWEYLFDESVLEAHLEALRGGTTSHPSAEALLQVFLDKSEQYSSDQQQGDDANHHERLLNRAAFIAHTMQMPLSKLTSCIEKRVQLLRLLTALHSLYGDEDPVWRAMLPIWQVDVMCRYDPFQEDDVPHFDAAEVVASLRVALEVAAGEVAHSIRFALGKACLLLQGDASAALEHFSSLPGSASVSRWMAACTQQLREGEQEESAAPAKRRRAEAAPVAALPVLPEPPDATTDALALALDSAQGPVEAQLEGLFGAFQEASRGRPGWEQQVASWCAAEPSARVLQPLLSAMRVMRSAEALQQLAKMCLRFCIRADTASVAWSVVGTLQESDPVPQPLLRIGRAACDGLARLVGDSSKTPYLEALSDFAFVSGDFQQSMRHLMSRLLVHPVWPLPMTLLLRCIALCKHSRWVLLQCVFLQMVPDERALVDAFSALRGAEMLQLDVAYLPWVYDNSLLELLIHRFHERGELALVARLSEQIGSSVVAALNYERNGRDSDPALPRCFFQSLWHKVSLI